MGFAEDMQKEDERLDKLREDYSSYTYTGDDCVKCGRNRVLKCNNGSRVCEKCEWDQDKNDYNWEYKEAFPF